MNKHEIGLKDGTTLTAYGTAIGPYAENQFLGVVGGQGRTAVAVSEVSYWIETEEAE